MTPTPLPGVTTVEPPVPVCVYNGKSYTQGQTWQDGCQYDCECVDAMTGQYRCTQRWGVGCTEMEKILKYKTITCVLSGNNAERVNPKIAGLSQRQAIIMACICSLD